MHPPCNHIAYVYAARPTHPSQERAALRKDPLFVLRGHLALSLGDEVQAAEAIRAIEVRVGEEEDVLLMYYGHARLLWPHLLPPGACGGGGGRGREVRPG